MENRRDLDAGRRPTEARLAVVCLGASYTGRYLAREFGEEASVAFLTRDPGRLGAEGLTALDPGAAAAAAGSPGALILDTVPAVAGRGGAPELPYRAALGDAAGRPGGAAYLHLSSTSVYPSDFRARTEDGLPTLDERSDTGPESARAEGRLLLERAVLAQYPEARILRCGGIYGPGRSVAARFRDGDFSRAGTGNRMVTRIHVHDLCRLILAHGRARAAPAVVNAVDERPSSNRETFSHLERVLGIEVPGAWRTAEPTGRRVVSMHARSLLGGRYVFPTYREGFAACLAQWAGR